MADPGIVFLNTPFAFEPHQPKSLIAVSGSVSSTGTEQPISILVQVLDMTGAPVTGSTPLDIGAGVTYHDMNPVFGLPAMYYAFPKAPDAPGSYQVRVAVSYPSGPIAPRMQTIQVFDPQQDQPTPRAADMSSPSFQIQFEQPAANARLSSVRPIAFSCKTRVIVNSVYGYFLLIEDATQTIVTAGFHRDWLLREYDAQITAQLKAFTTSNGPHSLVVYLLQMNQGAIVESRSHPIRLAGVAAAGGGATVPNLASTATVASVPKSTHRRSTEPTFVPEVPDMRIDINSAPLDLLTALPGIGKATAQRIIRARPLHSVDALATIERFPTSHLDVLRPILKALNPQ